MKGKWNIFNKLYKDEQGVSALETAIILIAFVVVAAIFAFTILSAGTTATEQSKEAIYAGLSEVRSTLELRGAIVAETDGTEVTDVVFSVANAAGGESIDLTAPVSNTMIIDYRDNSQRAANLTWTIDWIVQNDSDDLLEEGELAEITIDISSMNLGTSTQFALEIKPAEGGVVVVERTTPAYLDTIIDLR
ncbi:MAG: archaellin/type IV pilin N-terminal domain-containing protein [Candidatus Promineifilaceae bacterium]|nr:flagellin [Anaerolineaceae bacterium]